MYYDRLIIISSSCSCNNSRANSRSSVKALNFVVVCVLGQPCEFSTHKRALSDQLWPADSFCSVRLCLFSTLVYS